MKCLKIYVAHRYAGDTLETLSNIGRAVKIGVEIARRGHFPFIPHLDCLVAMEDGMTLPLSYYYDSSMAWLKVSDALFVVDKKDLETSKGVKEEYNFAVENNLPIFYKLSDLPKISGKRVVSELSLGANKK